MCSDDHGGPPHPTFHHALAISAECFPACPCSAAWAARRVAGTPELSSRSTTGRLPEEVGKNPGKNRENHAEIKNSGDKSNIIQWRLTQTCCLDVQFKVTVSVNQHNSLTRKYGHLGMISFTDDVPNEVAVRSL